MNRAPRTWVRQALVREREAAQSRYRCGPYDRNGVSKMVSTLEPWTYLAKTWRERMMHKTPVMDQMETAALFLVSPLYLRREENGDARISTELFIAQKAARSDPHQVGRDGVQLAMAGLALSGRR